MKTDKLIDDNVKSFSSFNDLDVVFFYNSLGNGSGVYNIRVLTKGELLLLFSDYEDFLFDSNGCEIHYNGSYITKDIEIIEASKLIDFILYESKYDCHSCKRFSSYTSRLLRVPDNCVSFLCNSDSCIIKE